jgi:hypothetical protein
VTSLGRGASDGELELPAYTGLVKAWRIYGWIGGGGTALLVFAIVFLSVEGDPASAYGLFFLAVSWMTGCLVVGLALLAISLARILAQRYFVKPSSS